MGDNDKAIELVSSSEDLPPILAGRSSAAVEKQVRSFYGSVAAMFEAWLARTDNRNSQRAYRADVMHLVEFLGINWPERSFELLKTTIPEVQSWRTYMDQELEYAPKTLNRRVCSVSAFFQFMREAAATAKLPIMVANPAHKDFIKRPAAEPLSPTEALSPTLARRLMGLPMGDDVVSYRDRAILAFYLFTGTRIGTGCRLQVADVHFDPDDPSIKIEEKGRGRSKRKIGVNYELVAKLQEYIEAAEITSGPLFRARVPSSKKRELTRRAMDESTMFRLLTDYLARLPRAMKAVELENGDEAEVCRYSPHTLRATTATYLLSIGVPIEDVQTLLGHKNISTTLLYDKRKRTTLDSASHKIAY